MQMRWVQLMAIAIGKIIFLSYLLERTGNIMHALNRLPGSAFFRKWRAAKCLFSLLLLSCAGISSTALAATIVFTVTDNSDAPNANATTPTTCVSTLGGTFAGACTLRAAIQAANYTLQTLDPSADVSIVFAPTLTTSVRTIQSGTSKDAAGNLHPYVDNQTVYVRCANTFISGAQSGAVTGATNACGQTQMISGGDTGTTTGAGGAWYWLKGTVPAGTGSLTIDFGGVIQVQNWADSPWETFYLGGKNITLTNSPNMTCGEAVFVVGSTANNITIDRVGLVNVAPTPAGEGTPFNCELYAEIHQGAQNVFFTNSTINSAIWNGNYGNNKGSAISVAASNGTGGTVSNIVVDNFTVTNLPNPIGGMQLEQFFQVMSNMTVNGLTIKDSNIALSPTGGNAPRAVVSVDGTINLDNGTGLAVTGNTFSLPIAAYTTSSPMHVSAPTLNMAASGTTQVVTVTDNNFTGGGDGVNIGGTGTAPGLIGNNKMTSQSRSAIRVTARDFFKISQNTLFSLPVAANSGISLQTTANGQTGWTPTLGVGASDTAACTWTFNITANANASEPAPYTVEAFWSPTGAGVNDAQVYLGSGTMAGASGTLTVPSYLSGQVRVTVTDSNSGGAQTSQLSTAANVTGFPCALKSGVLATTNNQPVGSSDLLEVYIVDGQGNAWTGGSDTVTFAAPPAGVTFNGGSAAVSCTTDSSGKCASPINASSSVAGTFTTPVTLSSSVAGATFSNLPLGGSPVSGAVTYQPSPVAYSFTGLPASTTGSEIAASPPSIAANGVSTSTLAVQLKDALGNLVTTCTDTVAFTLNAGTQGVPAVSVTGCSAGMYTGTVTSPVLVGSGTFGFTINGAAAVATATVSYAAATPSTSASTIVATPASIVANGSSTSVLRVQLVDASSNPINTCTNTVAFTLNGGTQGTPSVGAASCTAGIYTSTVTSPTAVGSGIFGFTINGSAAVATASVSYTAGPPSTSASTIVASPTSIIANGTATSTLTAQLKDASGNSIATCANTVAFTLNGGTQGSPAVGAGACSAGVYTATVTAPTAVGSGTFGFTINGSAATATAAVNYTAGSPSNGANGNLISASPLSVVADNTATSSISVTLRDANGNPATDTVAHTIVFTKTGVGTTTPAAPTCTIAANANPATCSVTVKSATVGTASFTATDNGTAVSNGSPVSVNFIAGPPSNTASGNLLSATPLSVMADGTSTGTVTVALQDANGNATVDAVAHTIGFVHTGPGTPSATSCTIAANANPARCSITVTSTVAGAASFTATDNNGTTTQSVANGSPAVINFTANAADPARSGVRTVTSPVTANGSATDVLEAFVGDVNGNPVAGSVVTFSPTANITFSGICTTNAAGTCQVTAKTTVAGSYTSGASIASGALSGSGVSAGGNTYGATAAYVFTAGAVDPANSTMSVDVNNQAAGGGQDVVSVVTKDAFGNPVTGVAVNFSVTPAGAAPATASCTTAGAAATCSVSFTSVTASTYSAAATVGAAAIGNSPQSMAFVAGNASASNSGLRVVSDNAAANGTATDVVEAYVRDAGGNPKGGEVVTFAGAAGVKLNGGAAGASATCTTGTSGATLGICSITATSTASGTYSIATSIPAGTLGGTFTVGANAYSPSAAQIHFVSVVNLSVTKANPGSLAVGTPFNYTFTVANAASAFGSASSVTIKDLVPAGISITGVPSGANVASATCTPNTFPFVGNGTAILSCTVSFTTPVAAGGTTSFNLPAVPTAVGSSTNTASYDPSGGISPVNPTAGCTTDCASTPVTPVTPGSPALTVTKANPGSLAVGTAFNYAFTVANAAGAFGPASSVTIKDLVPAGISITGVPSGANVASATCTPNTFPFVGNGTAILSCTVSFTTPVAAGGTTSFNLPAVPTAVGSSTNTASYDPSGGISPVNPTAGCTTDCASTPVTPVTPGTPALTVTKANPGSLAVGTPFNYAFSVSNAASAFGPATSVTIKDLVPAGISITGVPTGANVASATCTPNTFPFAGNGSSVLTCTVNFTTSVAAGGSTSFNLPAVPTAVGSSTNTASYDPSGGISPVNPTAGCTTDCASTPVTPVTPGTPALTVTKANPGSLAVGTPFNYAFSVSNAASAFGPATSVTIKDLVPAGISIAGVPSGANVASATCTPNTFPFAGNGSSVLTCTVNFTAAVAAGGTTSFDLPAVPTAVGSSTNTASYDPSGGINPVNPTAGCTTDCASTPVTPVTPGTPALTVTKANPGSLAVGTAFNYAFTVANAAGAFGPATSVTIKDLVPAGISITGVPTGANVASATCTPNAFPFAGNGSSVLTCTVNFTAAVAAGGSTSFNLPAVPTAVGSSTNTASYDPSGGISPVNPTAGCTTDCASTPVTPVTPGTPALTVTKANPGSLAVGTAFNYAFTVANAASAFGPATSVTIKDLVPAGISITGVPTGANVASATCTPNTFPFAGNGSSVLTCTVNFTAAVAAGGNTSFNLPAVPTAVGSSTNTASYDPSGGISPVNPTAGCTTDCASTPVTPVTPGTPALTVTKANPGSLAVGTAFNYAFSVSNAASAFGPATSVTIKDLVPAGISITGVPTGANVASATCTPNAFPFAGNGSAVLTCTVNFTAAVAAGGNTSFNLPAVPTAVGSSTNTASYDPSGGISPVNPTAGCTTDCASTPVTPVTPGTPALTVTKANPGSLAVGTPFNYAFSVSNAASAFGPATSVTIKDLVPAGISITGVPSGANVASATCTPNTFPFAGNGSSVLTCTVNFTTSVAAGGNTSFNLPAVPTAVGSSTNTASYDPSGGISPVNPTAGCTTDCASTPTTPVTPGTPALTVTKANPGSLAVGTAFNYAFTVANAAGAFGPATSVTIKDLVPAGISITGVPTGANVASATCTPNTFPFAGNGSSVLTCTVNFTASVAAGGSTSFNLPAVPTAVGSSTNTASYDPSGGISPVNPTAGCTTDCASTPVTPVTPGTPALTVTKANPGSLAVGTPFNYAFSVANAAGAFGPATSVTIKDLVPAGISITGVPTGANVASATCAPNAFPFAGNGSSVLTCTVNFTAAVAAGGNTSFNLPAVPTAVGSSTNTASYDPSGGISPVNPTAGCTTDCASTPVTPVTPGTPALTVTKANPGSLAVGTAFNYAFSVSNAASAFGPATSVTIKDLVPAGISITGVPSGANVASATCTPNTFPFVGNGTAILSCTVSFTTPVAAGGSTSFNLPAVPTAVGSSTNTASYDPSGGISPVNPTAGCTVNCASTPATPVTPSTQVPVAPTLTVSPTTVGGYPQISGTGTPGYTITVKDGSTTLCTAIVAADQTWSCTPGGGLPTPGLHTISATQTNPGNGNTGPATTTSLNVLGTTFTGPTATGAGNATATLSGGGAGCGFDVSQSSFVAAAAGAPGQLSFPYGNVHFVARGCTPSSSITVSVTWPGPVTGMAYWKFGPASTGAADSWYQPAGAVVSGNTTSVVVTDGGQGDDDRAANGVIVDPSGPARVGAAQDATPIPALEPRMLAMAMLLMLAAGLWNLRRRRG